MYYQVLSISAPVFILVAIGFFISKINIDLNQKTIGFLLTHVGSPCLIFHTLSTTKPNINILMEIGFAAVLVTVFASIFSVLLLFITKDKISPYFSCLIHPNSANLALWRYRFVIRNTILCFNIFFTKYNWICCNSRIYEYN